MIIDFHSHVFPERLAAKALDTLSRNSGGVRPQYDGTPGGLLRHLVETGVDKAVVLSIATNANQQASVNNFAIEINNGCFAEKDKLIAFGSVFPFAEDALAEIDRLHAAGIKGVKFHPEYQDFFVDDERVFPLYERLASYGMITVFHAGADIGKPRPVRSVPERIAAALPHFHGAPVVAAHFGGYMHWDGVEDHLVGRDVYLDTSYGYSHIPFFLADDIVRAHGASRVLFGTDTPWTDIKGEIALVRALNISAGEQEMILSGNARRLLGI